MRTVLIDAKNRVRTAVECHAQFTRLRNFSYTFSKLVRNVDECVNLDFLGSQRKYKKV